MKTSNNKNVNLPNKNLLTFSQIPNKNETPNSVDYLQMQKMQGHTNVFFAYAEEGLVREEDIAPTEKKQKKPSSARKRPSSKIARGNSAKKKPEEIK